MTSEVPTRVHSCNYGKEMPNSITIQNFIHTYLACKLTFFSLPWNYSPSSYYLFVQPVHITIEIIRLIEMVTRNQNTVSMLKTCLSLHDKWKVLFKLDGDELTESTVAAEGLTMNRSCFEVSFKCYMLPSALLALTDQISHPQNICTSWYWSICSLVLTHSWH